MKAAMGGSVNVERRGEHAFAIIESPAAGRQSVLSVRLGLDKRLSPHGGTYGMACIRQEENDREETLHLRRMKRSEDAGVT